jgi:hypothetical protein
MIAFASFLIGPSYLFSSFMTDTIGWIIPGLLITGLFTSFTTIGTYHEIYLPFVERHGGEAQLDGKTDHQLLYDKDKLGDILSGLYNGAYSIGVIIGPFFSSYIMIWFGDDFRKMSDVFAVFTFFYATVLLLAVYIPNQIRRKKEKAEIE